MELSQTEVTAIIIQVIRAFDNRSAKLIMQEIKKELPEASNEQIKATLNHLMRIEKEN